MLPSIRVSWYLIGVYNVLTSVGTILSFLEDSFNKYGDGVDYSDQFWNLSLEREPREDGPTAIGKCILVNQTKSSIFLPLSLGGWRSLFQPTVMINPGFVFVFSLPHIHFFCLSINFLLAVEMVFSLPRGPEIVCRSETTYSRWIHRA